MSTQRPHSHASTSFSSSSTKRPILSQAERTLEDEGDNEWDNVRSEFLNVLDERGGSGRKRKGGKKKDEPMKPITVVLYVIFFYLIWQILTRSTDTEILSHLAPSSPHYYSSHSLPESPSGNSMPYHLPYQFPHIPSPLPPTSSSSSTGESPGFFRLIIGLIAYPFYLIITLLASPIPILLNILHVLIWALEVLLLPFTSTGKILGRVFLYTPYTWIRAVGVALYPVYVFVGGMLGVGCVMGLGAGWAGRKGVEYLTRATSGSSRQSKGSGIRTGKPRAGSTSKSSYRSAHHTPPNLNLNLHPIHPKSSSDRSSSRESTPPNPRTPTTRHHSHPMTAPSLFPEDSVSRKGGTRVHVRLLDPKEGARVKEMGGGGIGKGTGREGVIVGTRRRGVRYEGD